MTTFNFRGPNDPHLGTSFIPLGSTPPPNGVYLPDTDTLGLSSSGVERIRFSPDGSIVLNSGTENGTVRRAPYASIAAAQASTVPTGVDLISVVVDGDIINYKREAGATALVTGGGATWQYAGGVLASNLTVFIPDDYPDFQTALQKLSVLQARAGVIINVRHRTSALINSAVNVSGGDYSHFILGMDPSFSAQNPNANKLTVGSSFPANTPVFTFIRCKGPRISFSLDCANIATSGFNTSFATLSWPGTQGLFIENVRYDGGESPLGCGIFANNDSDIFASGLVVRNSGRRNLHLTGSSRIKSHNSQWLNSGEINVFVSRGCVADFSAGVTITGGTTGIIVRRSIAALDNMTVSGCSVSGVNSENGSTVGARGINIQNCVNGARSLRGANLDVSQGVVTNNSSFDLRVNSGGCITCSETTTTNGSGNPNVNNTNVLGFNRFDANGFILTDGSDGQGDTITTEAQSFSGAKTFTTSLTSTLFRPGSALTPTPDRGFYTPNANDLAFATNTSQRFTIRFDGNIHTGSDMPSPTVNTTTGVRLNPVGSIQSSRSSGAAASFQRSTSDGNIVAFYRDTTLVGNINVTATGVNFSGNASTATSLETARQINGVSFDGSANITLPTVNDTENQSINGVKSFLSNSNFGRTSTDFDGSSSTAGATILSTGLVAATRSGNHGLSLNRTSSDGNVALLRRDGTVVGSISVTTTATAYNTSSDYRLKENVVHLSNAIERLKNLPVYRFNFKADPNIVLDGFLAHEAAEVVPESVTGSKDEVDENGIPVYQGIDQSKIVPLLAQALKDAIKKIEELEARVVGLEG